MACFSYMCTTTSTKGISKAGFDNGPQSAPPSPQITTTPPPFTPTCVSLSQAFSLRVLCQLSPDTLLLKAKSPTTKSGARWGASRRPPTVGNPCDEELIGFYPLFSGSHKRPRDGYASKYSEFNCCPMQASSMPKTGFDQIGDYFVRNLLCK